MDTITAGNVVPVALVILYFAFTVLTGLTESIREGLLTVFGQKITHALRGSMMDKYTNLTAGELTKQEPGTIVSRFVGDVDTVENLFTSDLVKKQRTGDRTFDPAAISVLVHPDGAEKYAESPD